MSALPTVALYASKEEIKNAHQLLFHPHMCIRCNKSFNLASNLGTHKCFQHPGCPVNGKWTCCGNPVYNLFYSKHFKVDSMYSCSTNMAPYPPPKQVRGCQPCDHTIFDKKWTYKDTERLHKIAGLIPFLNKHAPIEERPGFSVVKINSQKMPVLLRCSRRWIHWPRVDEVNFNAIVHQDKLYNFIHVEINYISFGGEPQQLLFNEDEWDELDKRPDWNGQKQRLDIKGSFVSAFYVYQYHNNDGTPEGDTKKKQINDLII